MAARKESAAASSAPATPSQNTLDSPVKQIQIEGLVVLKIIKHYQEEGQGSEVVQGVLLGLVVEDRLEITNCFPFPQHTEDDADFDEGVGDGALGPRRRRALAAQSSDSGRSPLRPPPGAPPPPSPSEAAQAYVCTNWTWACLVLSGGCQPGLRYAVSPGDLASTGRRRVNRAAGASVQEGETRGDATPTRQTQYAAAARLSSEAGPSMYDQAWLQTELAFCRHCTSEKAMLITLAEVMD
ncbi:hypothetical protein ANANG_G00180380 [Anguilla anguilla]|uniref:JAB1/MPN/MOV34 metalloenzyme domain-containing protein n=1 Tax=Anguilla anguilla TaxID=7936 RepID=A0A9D3RTP6_ANGAN|nr:hypothetical protein ANANG_G00180380 [Anguilla anguilla]